MVRKEKLTEYNKDNPLGWTEEEFRNTICTMCNLKIINNEPLTPLLNVYYMQEGDTWKNEHLKKIIRKERRKKKKNEQTN